MLMFVDCLLCVCMEMYSTFILPKINAKINMTDTFIVSMESTNILRAALKDPHGGIAMKYRKFECNLQKIQSVQIDLQNTICRVSNTAIFPFIFLGVNEFGFEYVWCAANSATSYTIPYSNTSG